MKTVDIDKVTQQ